MTFRKRVGIGLVVAATIASVLASLVIGQLAQLELTDAIGRAVANSGAQLADKMDRIMFERQREIQLLADTIAIESTDTAEIRRTLERIQATYPLNAWIGLTDETGTVIAATGGLLEGMDVSFRPWFQGATDGPYVGDVHRAELLANALRSADAEPPRFVDVAAPVTTPDGSFAGVLCVHLDWRWAIDMRDSMVEFPGGLPNLEYLVVDKAGRPLLSPPQYDQRHVEEYIEWFRRIASDTGVGRSAIQVWPDGTEYLTAIIATNGHQEYSGLGWHIVVRDETTEAFASVHRLARKIFLISLVLTGFVSFIGWLMAGRLTKPLLEIVTVADNLREGTARISDIPTAYTGEIGKVAQALKELVERRDAMLQGFLSAISETAMLVDTEGHVRFANRTSAERLNTTLEELIGSRFADHLPGHLAVERMSRVSTAIQDRRAERFEDYRDGQYQEHLIYPLVDANKVVGLAILGIDITERKRAEKEIQRQLTEKETLLKEVNHRIKNNMAQVESLLSLQANSTDNSSVRSALHDAMSRVSSTRILYDKLLIGEVYDKVSIQEYLEGLIDSLVEIFDAHSNVTVEKRITDFTLLPKDAISVGIILNELLTNVFKHAFQGTPDDRVLVKLERADSQVTLTVEDNGVGAKDGTEISTGFGSTIVSMLAEQFNGSFVMDGENGTRSTVTLFV